MAQSIFRYEKEFDAVQDVFELQVYQTPFDPMLSPSILVLSSLFPELWLMDIQADSMIFQRNLNNAFAYDLVPSPSVITAALKAARRVNDFPTAVRIFEGRSTPFSLQPPY